ncbi:MAG: S41 family peptidase, partial [Flavobacteriaceae bacterium]|nr:S41 family peptidase [Flavobacteriaceae bacterium]
DGLDPYTVFWSEQEVENSKINQRGHFSGVGASIKAQKDKVKILEIWKDQPADKAGLKPGDEIIKIDNVDLKDYKENAGDLLKGSPGSVVSVEYLRNGKLQKATITRASIDDKAVPFYELIDGDIAYIVLSKFNQKASRETIDALETLKSQGATKVILDLRGNPGGLLSEAVNVSNIFLPKDKLITYTESHIKKFNNTYLTQKQPVDEQIPLVVLVNGRSASASEIVSGAIQDYDRGVVIGARSFGKGLVQRPKSVSYGTQVKITISRYYTPVGRCIQAINYADRDEEGNPIMIEPENYNAYKTKNGRTVYDGGGILPDIELASAKYSPITTSLLKDDLIFDYATQYFYSHSVDDLSRFEFNDKAFNDFLNWLNKNDFDYDSEADNKLNEFIAVAEKENLLNKNNAAVKSLETVLNQQKEQQLKDKKAEIVQLLSDEIIKRYFYRDGIYRYHI